MTKIVWRTWRPGRQGSVHLLLSYKRLLVFDFFELVLAALRGGKGKGLAEEWSLGVGSVYACPVRIIAQLPPHLPV